MEKKTKKKTFVSFFLSFFVSLFLLLVLQGGDQDFVFSYPFFFFPCGLSLSSQVISNSILFCSTSIVVVVVLRLLSTLCSTTQYNAIE